MRISLPVGSCLCACDICLCHIVYFHDVCAKCSEYLNAGHGV